MTGLIIIWFVIMISIVAVLVHFQPSIDFTKDGNMLLWYNKRGERKYKIIY